MKLLIFNWRDIKNPAAGGAERYTHEIAKRLVSKGHEVTLFCSMFDSGTSEEVVDGIKIFRAGNRFTVYYRAKQMYKNKFSKEGYDIVIDEINTIPFFTPLYVKEDKIGLIHQLAREFWFYETPFPVSIIGYLLEPFYLQFYKKNKTITVSESTKSDLFDLNFEDVSIVPNGLTINPTKKYEKEEEPTIIYLGRLKKAKKVFDSVKAFKKIKQETQNAKMWIVGDGDKRYISKMKDYIHKNNIEDITFFGYVSNEKKIELLSKAWVMCFPGLREGWGQTIIEANVCGTPVVAFDVPGLRNSIKNGKTGFLAESEEDLKEKLILLLKDKELREKMSENALAWSKNFDWDKSTELFLKEVQNVKN